MEFKLTERQSYEILKHLGNHRAIIEKVNAEAYDILERYYERYSSVPKNYWFKPMSKSKFLEKMCKGSGSIHTRNEFGWRKEIYTFNDAEINIEYLRKFGIPVEPVAHIIIDAALDAPYLGSSEVTTVDNMYNLLMTYNTPPFVADVELLNMFHKVKESNEKRIEVLNNIGIKYEL
ncbi:hypothetical protein FDG95_gp108 [Pectobacterium phage vB_PcaM_CBB]|uniref:Uncharacterized protein n=1 Tax=Pectobacterium phage vB_PcaM_CBB TaxID=2772511 RepID=A0A1L2CUG7_9CAUD|nr:hypothetical protein FDG95_gp108 [Pectobacterium phage vB_PcaM_CBB]AMM43673.1 hypothetical protein CBB_108 [Pectobacterium phage vB_PcaM_CBB]